MIVYEVYYNDGMRYEPFELSYGLYSTREKAEELLRLLQKYYDFRPEGYRIIEHRIDSPEKWVLEYIARMKLEFEERND